MNSPPAIILVRGDSCPIQAHANSSQHTLPCLSFLWGTVSLSCFTEPLFLSQSLIFKSLPLKLPSLIWHLDPTLSGFLLCIYLSHLPSQTTFSSRAERDWSIFLWLRSIYYKLHTQDSKHFYLMSYGCKQHMVSYGYTWLQTTREPGEYWFASTLLYVILFNFSTILYGVFVYLPPQGVNKGTEK